MGISFSWPAEFQSVVDSVYKGCDYVYNGCDFGTGTNGGSEEATISGSICLNDENLSTNSSSGSLKGLDRNSSGSVSFASRRFERNSSGSLSFKARILERNDASSSSEEAPRASILIHDSDTSLIIGNSENCNEVVPSPSSKEFTEESAAVKLQKVYKSYRTRRNLADCAVVVEELWWQAIDFVTLKRSTVSFFDLSRHESASSRWARARIKAAKVGKGLSKDDKARKLAFQHWLEAIDPRHRYGHNLHFYYDAWFESDTAEPFFYWLDVGQGRDLDLDKCPRTKLQQQCIKYLGPKEREQYEVVVKEGRLVYKLNDELVDTPKISRGSKWIFVLSTSKKLYVGQKRKGRFQHSSFLAGGATSAAGRLVVDEGVLKSIWPYSGHYLPTEENFNEFISFLEENRVNLDDVQRTPADEEESTIHFGKNLASGSEPVSEAEKDEKNSVEQNGMTKECANTDIDDTKAESLIGPEKTQSISRDDNSETLSRSGSENQLQDSDMPILKSNNNSFKKRAQTSEEKICYKRSMSGKELEKPTEVQQKSLLERLESKKALQSYQLGKQVSFKWSTGAGPRIICVKDYPCDLRVKALEKVNLTPRCGLSRSPKSFVDFSRRPISPKCIS